MRAQLRSPNARSPQRRRSALRRLRASFVAPRQLKMLRVSLMDAAALFFLLLLDVRLGSNAARTRVSSLRAQRQGHFRAQRERLALCCKTREAGGQNRRPGARKPALLTHADVRVVRRCKCLLRGAQLLLGRF